MLLPFSFSPAPGRPQLIHGLTPQLDELEKLLYEQGGSGFNTPVFGVANCSTLPADSPQNGRTNSTECFRNAYHDTATANVFAGIGGLDASLSFETGRAENPGLAFAESLNFTIPFRSVRSPMADLIALGALVALGACSNGGVLVPFRGGRVDAGEPGALGVPEPQQDIDSHIGSFITRLIDDNRQDFDATVQQFVNNITQNPLAFGHNETTRSDARIFNAGGGVMIRKMAEDNAFFLDTCTSLVERMLNTVPKEIQLTDPVEPIAVKPDALSVQVNAADSTVTVSGKMSIINDGQTSEKRQFFIDFTPRDVVSGSIYSVQAVRSTGANTFEGAYAGIPSLIVYQFTTQVPIKPGISSFTVRLQDGATTVIGDNGGAGFSFSDTVIPQLSSSCLTLGANRTLSMNLTVAVRDDAQVSDVILSVPWPVPQVGSIVPRFERTNASMTKTKSLGGTGCSSYNSVFVRTGSDTISIMKSLAHDVIGLTINESIESIFNKWKDFCGSSCASQ